MFSSAQLFKSVQCPEIQDCNVINCIFLHEQPLKPPELAAYDPAGAGSLTQEDEPRSKRRRLEEANPLTGTPPKVKPIVAPRKLPGDHADPFSTPKVVKPAITTAPIETESLTRDVSPPPKRQPKLVEREEPAEEKLIPRLVPQAPAVLKTRLSLVEMLYKHMKILNQNAISKAGSSQSSLSDAELIRMVLDEEETAARKLSSDIYRNAMSQQVLRFKKMDTQQWQKYLAEVSEKRQVVQNLHSKMNGSTGKAKQSTVTTNTMSSELQVAILPRLQTKLEGLERFGYVTQSSTTVEVEKARAAVKASAGYEVCDRCTTRFQCFPGRNDHGELTTRGECNYHWARVDKSRNARQTQMLGVGDAVYPCCNQTVGSEGCTTAATHVFKVTDTKRLAALLQYEMTPANTAKSLPAAVAFDCEMGYTTQGLELIRLTAISWPDNKNLLDVLVRPYGEVLDLNTRFSGVKPEQFNSAPPHEAAGTHPATEHSTGPTVLQKVESTAAARQLLFKMIAPNTPLIGHAIDNDLNTCRIVHPSVIDTVLLYPHPRGLPIRYGLKVLASKYLDRAIQTGGARGHDSMEDSVATGDLVKLKVADKWNEMQLSGWRFQDGQLKGPASADTKPGKLRRD